MSLARTLMNGGLVGVGVDPARYGHSMGATRIAMESVEELHEIFMESFYETEQIELAAATEGVEVAGSRYEAMLEATNKSVLQRVKDFLKKLWEKVKAFFHNVKRFIASIVMSGKDFATKYKSDIEKINDLKDFEFEMYDYNDEVIDHVKKISDVGKDADDIVSKLKTAVNKIVQDKDNKKGLETNLRKMQSDSVSKIVDDVREAYNESWENKMRGERIGTGPIDADDYDKKLFGFFRNNATDESDKVKKSYTNVKRLMDTLISTKAEAELTSLQSANDNMYKKATDAVTAFEKTMKDDTNDTTVRNGISDICNVMTSVISKTQNAENKKVQAWKQAYKDRDADYKKCIMAAISHYRKQK